MKKICLFLAATLMLGLTASAQKKTETTKEESKIHIKFGRVSKDCRGFGICEFWIDITVEEAIRIINALKTRNDGLTLSFNPQFIEKNEIVNSEYLIIEEDYAIDPKTSKSLGFKVPKVLKQGKYPITFDAKSKMYNCTIN